ncbi:MAG TPA: energy-coupling factor ABC transporter permease, partial [Aggregatilineaceae bacterium]|nr:energy-coupling factor ABC transporter permease [Aggregatilineaceae bacterium]
MFLAMHIPDGFINVPVAVVGWMLMAMIVGFALRQTRDQLGERQIPMMGVLAAFIFAAQMINFPVAGGTSGHLLGGLLAAIVLGPWAAVLVMMTVIGVQALLFQDGGLLAVGFNTVNMGILTVFVGYAIYDWFNKRGWQQIGIMVAAWVSVEAAAIATTLELVVSGTSALDVAFPAMVGVHALIGIGEALVTVAVISFVKQSRPDLLEKSPAPSKSTRWIAVGLLIALAVAFASPLADSDPDGLERVAEDKSFLDEAKDAPFEILPDYTIPFIENEAVTTIAAGVIGVLVVLGIG